MQTAHESIQFSRDFQSLLTVHT